MESLKQLYKYCCDKCGKGGLLNGVNVPGYDFHFLTQDRKAGGHVLAWQLSDISFDVDNTYDFAMELPKNEDFYRLDSLIDKSGKLAKVEK